MWIRIAILAALVGGIVLAYLNGWFVYLEPKRVQAMLIDAGPVGPILFVGLYVLAELVHIPAVLFVIAAGVIWPLQVAIPTAWVGSVTSATTIFLLARYFVSGGVQEALRRRLPERVREMDDALEKNGFRSVALLRLVTFMLPIVHWGLGISRVSFRDAFLGTAVGLAPGVIAFVVLGDTALKHWHVIQPWAIGLIAAVVLWRVVRRVRVRRQGRKLEANESAIETERAAPSATTELPTPTPGDGSAPEPGPLSEAR